MAQGDQDGFKRRLVWAGAGAAREAIARWPEENRGALRRLTVGENATWAVVSPQGRFALRLYQPGRWTTAEIGVEHAFMAHLGPAVNVSPPVAGLDGETVQVLSSGERAALFPWAPGRRIRGRVQAKHLQALGGFLHRMHEQTAGFTPAVERVRWDAETLVQRSLQRLAAEWGPVTGDPRSWDRSGERVLRRWQEERPALSFLHADLHLSNVHFAGEAIHPFDFDDCGWAPLAWDLTVLVCYLPHKPQLWRCVLEGYNAAAPEPVDPMWLLTLMATRQIQLGAWVLGRREIFSAEAELVRVLKLQLDRLELIDRWIDAGRLPDAAGG